MATKGQTCIAGKSNGNTCGKALAKIVARATGRTRKWKIAGKSEPRRHIAGPHNIVCSGWLAQAASEIVLYAGEMNIFQPMIVVGNDQIPKFLPRNFVGNCPPVVFFSDVFSVSQLG